MKNIRVYIFTLSVIFIFFLSACGEIQTSTPESASEALTQTEDAVTEVDMESELATAEARGAATALAVIEATTKAETELVTQEAETEEATAEAISNQTATAIAQSEADSLEATTQAATQEAAMAIASEATLEAQTTATAEMARIVQSTSTARARATSTARVRATSTAQRRAVIATQTANAPTSTPTATPTPRNTPTPTNTPVPPSKLAFMNRIGGQIYVVNVNGTGLRQVSSSGMDPSISPDGSTIAFARWGTNPGIYLVNPDGSNERQLIAVKNPRSPVWSPDGTQIAINYAKGDVVNNCDDFDYPDPMLPIGSFNIVATPTEFYTDDRGNTIASRYRVCYSIAPEEKIARLDMNGSILEEFGEYISRAPAWSPSGDIIFDTPGKNDQADVFSPDGSRRAVTNEVDGRKVIDVISGGSRSTLAVGVSPTWSPDGSQIAYFSNQSGPWEIWVMSSNGSNQRVLIPASALPDVPFQHDGNHERMLDWGR
jgi:hypothetical protein